MREQREENTGLKVMVNTANSLIEYSVLLGVVAIAVLFMTNYVRRSLQGHIRENAQIIGDRYDSSGKYMAQETVTINRNIVTNVVYDTVDIGGQGFDRQTTNTTIFQNDTRRTKDSAITR